MITLERLINIRCRCENAAFMSCIQRLESDRQCQGLDMRSFLMLPMQRVTRYPLLVIAILDRIGTDTEQQRTAQAALHLANQVSLLRYTAIFRLIFFSLLPVVSAK